MELQHVRTRVLSMKVQATLLDAMRLTKIRACDIARRDDEACKHGTIRYRLREPSHAVSSSQTLTRIGDTKIGNLMLSHVHDRFGTEIAFPEGHPWAFCIMSVLQGVVHCQSFKSDNASTAKAGHVLLAQTEPGAEALTADDSERLNLWIDRHSLLRRLEAMLDRKLDIPLVFAPEEAWLRGTAASLQRLVRYVVDELIDPYSLFAGGVGVAAFEDMAIRIVLEGTLHSYTNRLARMPTKAPLRAIRRAEDFMRENLHQPVTVEDIAQAAGCSARVLAATFRAEREQTITAVLRDLRLEAAHNVLVDGDPTITIHTVCTRFGFSNAGRFAAMYHERFGVLPRQSRNMHD